MGSLEIIAFVEFRIKKQVSVRFFFQAKRKAMLLFNVVISTNFKSQILIFYYFTDVGEPFSFKEISNFNSIF